MIITQSQTVSVSSYIQQFFVFLLFIWLVQGCALSPPVQEMSNARQTIQAAKEANASKFAPEYLREAEDLMKSASEALDSGDYLNARDLAISAHQQAIKARQKSLSKQKNEKF